MNDAKTVLFAISMDALSPSQAKTFEERTMIAIRSGNRNYFNSNSVHCDYKDGLIKMCQQYRPSAAIINELLPGIGNVFDIAKEIKSEFPEIIIVILLKDNRVVGDAVLANLAAAGIYNWISAPWKPELVANLVVSPKKMKDVEAYIPKIVERANGLAFDTKLVERVEDKLDDIITPNSSGSNNALAVDGKVEDIQSQKENLNVNYHKVVGGNKSFGFGNRGGIKKSGISLTMQTSEKKEETPIVENKEVATKVEVPAVETKPVEERKIENIHPIEKPKPDFNKIMQENKSKETPKANVDDNKKKLLDKLSSMKKPVEEKKVETEVKKPEPKVEKPKLLSLSEYNFVPRYKKILFVRALPLSTVFPVHIAKLSKAKFVDFNKESCYDKFEDVHKTTIKEAKLPDGELIVADAVAGNGIEKLVSKFDYVVAIVPEDEFVINTFVKRYPNLADLILVQNSAKLIDFKTTKNIFGDKLKAISFLNEKTPNIHNSLVEGKLLMDDVEYAKSVNFIVKNLNK